MYIVLLKATIASFSGFGSLPQIREDLVIRRQVLTDDALNRAVLVARTTPGAMGVYVVSVGYAAAGAPGAVAGWLALITPAFVVIPLHLASLRAMPHPRARNAVGSLVVASAALIIYAGAALLVEVIGRWRLLIGV